MSSRDFVLIERENLATKLPELSFMNELVATKMNSSNQLRKYAHRN
jgi:hypothetical protein